MNMKLVVTIILSNILLVSCAGVSYPRIFFDITPMDDTPDYSSSERFENIERYKQEIIFSFSQPGNSFKKSFLTSIFVKKPYKVLKINSISYHSEYGNGIFLEDAMFTLPEKITPEDNSVRSPGPDYYFLLGGYYWSMFLIPMDEVKRIPSVDFQKVFRNQKPGNRFEMTIIVDYTFDDEESRSVELFYEVYANKNRYVSPLMGM